LQDNIDLSNYDTLQIPATCVDGGIEYRITTIDYDAFYEEFSF
jgi:hypothetical protein